MGAVVIQLAAACISNTSPSGAGGPDGGPLGLLDAMLDAIGNVVDGTTPEAKADTDAGPPAGTCGCAGAFEPGSRLKGVYETGSDGMKVYDPTQMWDSQDQAYVTVLYSQAGDVFWANPGAAVFYLDSACTQPIIGFTPSTTPEVGQPVNSTVPPYAFDYEGYYETGYGGLVLAAYAVGAPTSTPATVYAHQGGCSKQSPLPGSSWYSVGAQRPFSSFVQWGHGHD
jgi:hypothetical protein